MERIRDKYGPTIIVDLEKYKVHLPQRLVKELDEKIIKELNKKDNLHLIIIEIKTIKDKETALVLFNNKKSEF